MEPKTIKNTEQKPFLSIRELCHIAVFTTLICVLSPISIPLLLGVPLTLQTFVILLAGVTLGPKKATIAVIAYILLGMCGLPVFAGFVGGPGVLLLPAGGFLLSFPLITLAAGIGSTLSGLGEQKKQSDSPKEPHKKTAVRIAILTAGMVAGVVVNYVCGTLYFMAITGLDLKTALIGCIVPFLPLDTVKVIAAGILGTAVKTALKRT